MKIRTCTNCGEYKYIESDGLCRDCFGRSDEYYYTYPNLENRFSSKVGFNQVVLGMIGSGKTVGNKIEIYDIYQNKDVNIFVIDMLGGYHGLMTELTGSSKSVNKGDSFNIMDIKKGRKNSIGIKIDFVSDLLSRYLNINSNRKLSLLSAAIRESYKAQNIIANPKTHNKQSPNVSSLINILDDMRSNPSNYGRVSSRGIQKKTQSEIDDLLGELRTVVKEFGVNGNMNLSDNTLQYFDLSNMSPRIGSIKMESIVGQIWEFSKTTDKPTLLYIDNATYLFESKNFVEPLFRGSRHHNLGICLSMIPIQDVLKSTEYELALDNCRYRRLHKLTGSIHKVQNAFNLSDKEVSYLRNARCGNGKKSGSDVLIIDEMAGNRDEHEIVVNDSLLDDIHK